MEAEERSGAQRVELGGPLGAPAAALRVVDPRAVQAVVHEAAQVVEVETEVAHHHGPRAGGRDVVQGGVVGVGVDAQAQAGHAADRVVQRPALGRQRAQVVGVGGHHGEQHAAPGTVARELRVVHHGVAVVDAVHLQQFQGGAHVGPGHAELARVRGGLEAGAPRVLVRLREQLGRALVLAVVDADADHLVAAVRADPLHHLGGGLRAGFAVHCGDEAAHDAQRPLGVADGLHDRVLRGGIGNAGDLHRAGGVPEELGITHVVRGRVFQVLDGEAVEVGRGAHQLRVQRAQHAQHAHGFFATGVEAGHFFVRQRRAGAAVQLGEGVAPHRAEQMAVQLHLRDGQQKAVQGLVGRVGRGGMRPV